MGYLELTQPTVTAEDHPRFLRTGHPRTEPLECFTEDVVSKIG